MSLIRLATITVGTILSIALSGGGAVASTQAVEHDLHIKPAASLQQNKYNLSDYESIKQQLAAFGVSSKAITGLIYKLKSGIRWDSMTEGKEPIKTEHDTIDGFQRTIERYADGSVKVYQVADGELIKKLSSEERSAWVGKCASSSWSHYATYYKNCPARASTALYTVGFDFNYQNVQSLGRSVTWAGNSFVRAFGVSSVSNDRLYKLNSRTYRYKFRASDPSGTFDMWLDAGVANDGHTWADFSY